MPITTRLLNKARNRQVTAPAWITMEDWLQVLAKNPVALPLVDFGERHQFMRVGVTALNWFLLDLFGLRQQWYNDGWLRRDELWLLINPMRYRILGHQPHRPYALDVRDFLAANHARLLQETLMQHPFFACAPTVHRHALSDDDAERMAAHAPWGRVAVLDEQNQIIGMVTGPTPILAELPPVLTPVNPRGTNMKGWS